MPKKSHGSDASTSNPEFQKILLALVRAQDVLMGQVNEGDEAYIEQYGYLSESTGGKYSAMRRELATRCKRVFMAQGFALAVDLIRDPERMEAIASGRESYRA